MKPPENILVGGEEHLGGGGSDHRVFGQKSEVDILQIGERRWQVCDQGSDHGSGEIGRKGSEGDGGNCRRE